MSIERNIKHTKNMGLSKDEWGKASISLPVFQPSSLGMKGRGQDETEKIDVCFFLVFKFPYRFYSSFVARSYSGGILIKQDISHHKMSGKSMKHAGQVSSSELSVKLKTNVTHNTNQNIVNLFVWSFMFVFREL